MATVKKNNKKKIVVPICLVLVVAIILVAISAKNYAAYGQFRLKTDGEEVTLSTISTQNIIECWCGKSGPIFEERGRRKRELLQMY